MDTLSKDSYKLILIFTFILSGISINAFANNKKPAQILADSYQLLDRLTAENAEGIISDLNQALGLCTDLELEFRIKYRIGILYFKVGYLNKALDYFAHISDVPDCPDLVRLCALNMAGQIYRMAAKDKEALDAFEKLIVLSKRILPKDPNGVNLSTVLKLNISAVFTKAEIYQYKQKYDSAIAEYNRVLVFLKENKMSVPDSYVPSAMDKISQLSLMCDDLEGFSKTTQQLIEKYPGYYRIPIIRFEIEVVKNLKEKNPNIDFPRGSFDAPARLIALIKNSGSKELKDKVTVLLKDLCSQHLQSYGGILLGYHYAWLLDASGEQKQAAKVLEDVCKQAVAINPDVPGTASVISTLTDYAKLQQAVIFGEKNKYREALEIVYSLKPDPNDVHMLNLSDSIEKALQTLKREVPKDVNDK